MKDMINRILSVDKTAREAKDKIQKENVTLEEEISQRKNEIRSDYLERAKERVEHNRKLEEEAAKSKIVKVQNSTAERLKKLEKMFEDNKDIWAKKIVERVLTE